jgi:hypothetical protein
MRGRGRELGRRLLGPFLLGLWSRWVSAVRLVAPRWEVFLGWRPVALVLSTSLREWSMSLGASVLLALRVI